MGIQEEEEEEEAMLYESQMRGAGLCSSASAPRSVKELSKPLISSVIVPWEE